MSTPQREGGEGRLQTFYSCNEPRHWPIHIAYHLEDKLFSLVCVCGGGGERQHMTFDIARWFVCGIWHRDVCVAFVLRSFHKERSIQRRSRKIRGCLNLLLSRLNSPHVLFCWKYFVPGVGGAEWHDLTFQFSPTRGLPWRPWVVRINSPLPTPPPSSFGHVTNLIGWHLSKKFSHGVGCTVACLFMCICIEMFSVPMSSPNTGLFYTNKKETPGVLHGEAWYNGYLHVFPRFLYFWHF